MAESAIKKETAVVMQSGTGGGPSGGIAANSYYDSVITFNPSFNSVPVVSAAITSTSEAGGMGRMSLAVNSVTNTGFTARIYNGDTAARWPAFARHMPDYSTVLATIDTVGGSWTATEDSCIVGYIGGKTAGAAALYVNGVEVCRGYPGNAYSGAITFPVFLLVKQGDTVSTRNIADVAYLLNAFALQ